MLYAVLFHSIAGAVAGSIFRVRILLVLSTVVFIEAIVTAFINFRTAEQLIVINLIAVQGAYLVGIFIRGGLDGAGNAMPSTTKPSGSHLRRSKAGQTVMESRSIQRTNKRKNNIAGHDRDRP